MKGAESLRNQEGRPSGPAAESLILSSNEDTRGGEKITEERRGEAESFKERGEKLGSVDKAE